MAYIESHAELVMREMLRLIAAHPECCNTCHRRTNDCDIFGIHYCYYRNEVDMLCKSLGRVMNGPEK